MITYWINKMLPPKKKANVFSQILSTLLLQISSRKKLKILIKKKKTSTYVHKKLKKHTFCKKEKNQPLKKRRLFSWQLASHHDLNDVLKFKSMNDEKQRLKLLKKKTMLFWNEQNSLHLLLYLYLSLFYLKKQQNQNPNRKKQIPPKAAL